MAIQRRGGHEERIQDGKNHGETDGSAMNGTDDEPTCAGCGIPLSPDEVYACADCSDWWAMNGLDIEKEKADGEPKKRS